MHIVIQMIDDPDRKVDHNEYDRNRRNKNAQIPKRSLFFPNVNKKDELNEWLNKSKRKNGYDGCLKIKIKEFWIQNNKIGRDS